MATYKTPDVHIEEIPLFPPSVAEVETAIPAFVGYTQRAEKDRKSLRNKPTKVKSLLQFKEYFGGAPDPEALKVVLREDNSVKEVTIVPQFFLYDSVRMFYSNGGGDCYIVSVGGYDDDMALGDTTDPANKPGLLVGLKALEKYDEPTILLFPDAVLLRDASQLATLQQEALAQCNKLQDRFTVMDLFQGDQERSYDNNDVVTVFRNGVGAKYLKYGAAYYPWIETNLDYLVAYEKVKLYREKDPGTVVPLASISKDPKYVDQLDFAIGDAKTLSDYIEKGSAGQSLKSAYAALAPADDKADSEDRVTFLNDVFKALLALSFQNDQFKSAFERLTTVDAAKRPEPIFKTYANLLKGYDEGYPDGALEKVVDADYPADYKMADVPANDIYGDGTAAEKAANGRAKFSALLENIVSALEGLVEDGNEILKNAEETVQDTNPLYKTILQEIRKEVLTLPPSGAIAGIYAAIDRDRGVWKAPANTSLSRVIGPAVNITAQDQQDLNVDVEAGKSVNAIRSFAGKGTLVWGARTLAGNDNEWRYISVRRFFNMVEESVKKSTYWAVFEPNDANTWIKVKSMIENYLIDKWRDGALQGAKPDEAFYVKVGLGITMTAQDILNGYMNVEIGMAVVRPAEFIVLKFSHKMVES